MTLSFRTSADLFLGLLLIVAGIATWAHHDGYDKGQITQKIATDKHTLKTAQHAEQEANVKADYYRIPIAQAKVAVANARHDVRLAQIPITISGDQASVGGDTNPKIVIPALIGLVNRYTVLDSVSQRLDSLHDKHASADSIAREAAAHTEAASVNVINDLTASKSPRCGSKCGIAIGAGSVVVALIGLHQIGFHF